MNKNKSQALLSPPPTPCMSQDSARLYDYEWHLQQLSHATGVDRSGLHKSAFANDQYDETKFWSTGYPHFNEFGPPFHMTNGFDSGISQPGLESVTRPSASHAPTRPTSAGVHSAAQFAESVPPFDDAQPSPQSLEGVPADDEQGLDEMDFAIGDDDDGEEERPKSDSTLSGLQKRKLKRFRLTHSQTRFLMSEFAKQAHPDAAHRERLSREIPGLTPRQVQVWFQNRRAKLKRLTIEDRERMTKSRALPVDFSGSTVSSPHLAPARPASITSAPVRLQPPASQTSDATTRGPDAYRQGPVGSASLTSPEQYPNVSRKTSIGSHFDLTLPDSATTATMTSSDSIESHVQGLVAGADVHHMSSDASNSNYLRDFINLGESRGNFPIATVAPTTSTPWWNAMDTGAASFDWTDATIAGSNLPQRGNTDSALHSNYNDDEGKSVARRATFDSAESSATARACTGVGLYNQLYPPSNGQHTDLQPRRSMQGSSSSSAAARLSTRDDGQSTTHLLASPASMTNNYAHYLDPMYQPNADSGFQMYPTLVQPTRAPTSSQQPQQQQQYHQQNPQRNQQPQQQQQRVVQSGGPVGRNAAAFSQSLQPVSNVSPTSQSPPFGALDMRAPPHHHHHHHHHHHQPQQHHQRWTALAGAGNQVMTDAALVVPPDHAPPPPHHHHWEDPNNNKKT